MTPSTWNPGTVNWVYTWQHHVRPGLVGRAPDIDLRSMVDHKGSTLPVGGEVVGTIRVWPGLVDPAHAWTRIHV